MCIFTWFHKANTSKLKTKEKLKNREKEERGKKILCQGKKSIINCNIKHELCIPVNSNNNNNNLKPHNSFKVGNSLQRSCYKLFHCLQLKNKYVLYISHLLTISFCYNRLLNCIIIPCKNSPRSKGFYNITFKI